MAKQLKLITYAFLAMNTKKTESFGINTIIENLATVHIGLSVGLLGPENNKHDYT